MNGEKHGGEHPPDTFTKPSFVGTHRPINYPVQFDPGDKCKCANTGHIFEFRPEHGSRVFASEEELQTYICDCIEGEAP